MALLETNTGLTDFLLTAKKKAYAGNGKYELLEDSSKEFTYEEEEFYFSDNYLGDNPFSGSEVVWQQDKVLWTMNYFGRILLPNVPKNKIYRFLKAALLKANHTNPFRGPPMMNENDLYYFNLTQGDLSSFDGLEIITCEGIEVYKLRYHGGSLAQNEA